MQKNKDSLGFVKKKKDSVGKSRHLESPKVTRLRTKLMPPIINIPSFSIYPSDPQSLSYATCPLITSLLHQISNEILIINITVLIFYIIVPLFPFTDSLKTIIKSHYTKKQIMRILNSKKWSNNKTYFSHACEDNQCLENT